jgi:hypothetical protein
MKVSQRLRDQLFSTAVVMAAYNSSAPSISPYLIVSYAFELTPDRSLFLFPKNTTLLLLGLLDPRLFCDHCQHGPTVGV